MSTAPRGKSPAPRNERPPHGASHRPRGAKSPPRGASRAPHGAGHLPCGAESPPRQIKTRSAGRAARPTGQTAQEAGRLRRPPKELLPRHAGGAGRAAPGIGGGRSLRRLVAAAGHAFRIELQVIAPPSAPDRQVKGGIRMDFCRKENGNKEESTREYMFVFLLPELRSRRCRILSSSCAFLARPACDLQ